MTGFYIKCNTGLKWVNVTKLTHQHSISEYITINNYNHLIKGTNDSFLCL